MPSSFSPSLRIELIAPGEQAGTWGTTTNTNLGTLLESAIAGLQTVSVISGNQALTIADGAADQSRSAVLRFTTTTGAPFNVYAPPVSKQYTIVNASAFAMTIFASTVAGNTTAAGTGVTVPAGRTMTVRTDGVDFVQQNTHFISPEYSGTLTGGTGVVNLGAGQFYKAADGKVGIGTSSPAYTLEVNSSSGGTIAVGDALGQDLILTGGATPAVNAVLSSPLVFKTNNTERVRITSAGQLGVGTISFQNQSPAGSISFPQNASLQTGAFGRIWNPAQQIGQTPNSGLYGMASTYLAYYDAGWKSLGGGVASAITIDEGNFSFSNSNSVGAPNSALTWTTRLMVNTSGDVGIGTTSPSSRLTVNGEISVLNNFALRLGSNQGGGATILYNGNGNLDITPRSGFSTIFTAGNVGVGTNSPVAPFQVAGSAFLASGGTGAVFIPSGSALWMNGFAAFGSGIGSNSTGQEVLMHAGGGQRARLTGSDLTTTVPQFISVGHGSTFLQLTPDATTPNQRGILTAWCSEPGMSYLNGGIGGNVNAGGPYYGRQNTDAPFGVYTRYNTEGGNIEFWRTTGTPNAINGQGEVVGYFNNASNFYFNSGYGWAGIAYGVRAFASINGDTMVVNLARNLTVSRPATGRYVFTFGAAMPDANYTVLGSTRGLNSGCGAEGFIQVVSKSTTSFEVINTTGHFGNVSCQRILNTTMVDVTVIR